METGNLSSQVSIVYKLSEAGRRASLLAGGNGREIQVVNVPATKELLDIASILSDGSAWIFGCYYEPLNKLSQIAIFNHDCKFEVFIEPFYLSSRDYVLDAPPADAGAWALSIPRINEERRAAAERKAAEARAKHEAELESRRSNQRALIARWMTESNRRDIPYVPDLSDEELVELRQELVRRNSQYEAEKASEQRAREEEREKNLAEAERWGRAHGSMRLKKAIEVGLLSKSLGIYRDERLVAERPGWCWQTVAHSVDDDVINPPESVLDFLLEAKAEIDGEAKLVRVTHDEGGDEYCDDDTEEEPQWAVKSEFLGRDILRFV